MINMESFDNQLKRQNIVTELLLTFSNDNFGSNT